MSLENDPQNHQNPTDIRMNHSGNLPEGMKEVPLRPFNETSLQQAVDGGMVIKQPDTLPSKWDESRSEINKSAKTDRKFGRKALAAGASLLLAAGLAAGWKSMNSGDERAAPVGPVATAPANVNTEHASPSTSETTKPVETKTSFETFMASFDISAEKYTTPQAITAAYIERYNNWMNAGLTIENEDTQMANDPAIMIRAVEAKFDSGIASRLFTTNETATSLVSSIEKIHDSVVTNYQLSWSRGDAVRYAVNDELLSAKLISSDNPDFSKATSFGVHSQIHATDNGDQNVAPYYRKHNSPGQLDMIRNDDINFVRDAATNTWKVDSSYLISSVDHSK